MLMPTKNIKNAKQPVKLSSRKFYETKIVVTVLSEEPLNSNAELDAVHEYIVNGPCSGEVLWKQANLELNGREMASALRKQGSEAGFFRLTDKGEDAE
jgi:hypothetical protein